MICWNVSILITAGLRNRRLLMSDMIRLASGFQYSVNIGYDLNNEDKIRSFIPTTSALNLLEEILLSTQVTSTERARVLIGAYGKGKSHIMLMILSMLLKKDISLFSKVIQKAKGTDLCQLINNYYESDNKLLPIIVTGNSTSLTQGFLLALQRALSDNDLLDVMPETNFKAAIYTIEKWKTDYPDTLARFEKEINVPLDIFIDSLEDFNVEAYDLFEQIYPTLTAGSVFNPFLGFDVVELYESTAGALKRKGYSGIFIVYDEFSKYLESNISSATVNDTKMLQDFAEKCNRSGEKQMHLMLISHKEIANYIDVLPKRKVDGWRGVSDRFLHVHLNNNFSQTYEIIESVIQKQDDIWEAFKKQHNQEFLSVQTRYHNHPVFTGIDNESGLNAIVYGCYPLQPISTFILPRLSERVAQNERTLFTFLSAKGVATLSSFLENVATDSFSLITPDWIYDYFQPVFKKEIYSGELHKNYILTESILERLETDSLESKIVKTISLIYILEQFEKLRPTREELIGIYSVGFTHNEVEQAISNLIEKEFVVYLKRSNSFLQLKQSSGVDVQKKISDLVQIQLNKVTADQALNDANFDNYLYPSRYNDTREMTRYFGFKFIASEIINDLKSLQAIIDTDISDGMVLGVLPQTMEEIPSLKEKIIQISSSMERVIFVVPKKYNEIDRCIREYRAISDLKAQAGGDRVLFDEYEVIYEDLRDLINSFIAGYTRPELFRSNYYYGGKERKLKRKADFTALLSDICDEAYSKTPIVNNEALNRNEATTIAKKSRNKVVAALLRPKLEPGLGLSGTGQDVSIMRSTLVRTGLLEDYRENITVNLHPDSNSLISEMMEVFEDYIGSVRNEGKKSFLELYERICTPKDKIALRRELVPIYLALVLHVYKQEIVISDKYGQVSLSADTLIQINSAPDSFWIEYLDWSEERTEYIENLEVIFKEYVDNSEKDDNPYKYIDSAMRRWYLSLPKYAKDMRRTPAGDPLDNKYIGFMDLMKKNRSGTEFLFKDVAKVFSFDQVGYALADDIKKAKMLYDNAVMDLQEYLCTQIKGLFTHSDNQDITCRMSLKSVIQDWCNSLNAKVFEQLFTDGTDRCLGLFRTISNDEKTFIENVARMTTDLRLEDWDSQMISMCLSKLETYKQTAEAFCAHDTSVSTFSSENTNVYQISFIEGDGNSITKRFDKVPVSKRASLLFNKLTADIDSFGQALTEAEKRQILMDVLRKLC